MWCLSKIHLLCIEIKNKSIICKNNVLIFQERFSNNYNYYHVDPLFRTASSNTIPENQTHLRKMEYNHDEVLLPSWTDKTGNPKHPPESSWPQCSEALRRTWGWCWRGQSFEIALFFTVYEMPPSRLLLVPRDEMVNSQELSFIYLVKEVYHLDWNKISLFLRIFHIEPQLVVARYTLLTFTWHVLGC